MYFQATNFFILILAIAVIRSAPVTVDDGLNNPEIVTAFEDFLQEHQRTYSLAEKSFRYKVFAMNYNRIKEFNANPKRTCTLEINKFADLTDAEFKRYYLSKTIARGSGIENYEPSPVNITIDWREKNKVTPVKDQGMCGSCWTFSSISVVESLIAIKGNKPPIALSEQELVDCCRGQDYKESNGCNGGEEEDALNYIKNNGIVTEKDYPYYATDRTCKAKGLEHTHQIKGHENITDREKMENTIQEQTISVAIAAGHHAFRFYKEGIISEGCPDDDINHAVTIVGAGNLNDMPYWLIRNSWGSNWGDKGHVRIMRTKSGCGPCGVNCHGKAPNILVLNR